MTHVMLATSEPHVVADDGGQLTQGATPMKASNAAGQGQSEATIPRKSKTATTGSQGKPVPKIKEGKYSDGHPLDRLQYLEVKVILKGDRFTSVETFQQFAKYV